jgi:hypothetical protein
LTESDFNDEGEYTSTHPTIPLLSELMTAVQIELTATKTKLVPMNKDDVRSLAQTVTIKQPTAPMNVDEGKQNMIATVGIDINGSVVLAAEFLRYL